jgi:hypothetical protein
MDLSLHPVLPLSILSPLTLAIVELNWWYDLPRFNALQHSAGFLAINIIQQIIGHDDFIEGNQRL